MSYVITEMLEGALAQVLLGRVAMWGDFSVEGWSGKRLLARDRYGVRCEIDLEGKVYYDPEEVESARRLWR